MKPIERKKLPTYLAWVLVLAVALLPAALAAQEEGPGRRPELGFWLGASNPMPQTATDEVLDANIGGGLFFRIQWPWILHLELGLSVASYTSRTTQQLTTVPLYMALSYRLPLSWPVEIFLKAGGGTSYLEVRPANRSGWDPLVFAGTEFSIQAGRKVRVGLRLDYNLIYERHLEPPPEDKLTRLFGSTDPRYQGEPFRLRNGSFFHFGLMVSFFL